MNKSGIYLGIDIGGTKIKIGYIEGDGALQELGHYSTPRQAEDAARLLTEEIGRFDLPGPLSGIGIGCPGPIDHKTGTVLDPPNLKGWHGFPLTETLEDTLGVPVALENDGNAGALGEAKYGSGRGYNHVLYLALGTGLGAGLIIGGKVYHGAFGLAAEIWSFQPGVFGQVNGNGVKYYNLNDFCSGNGIVKQVKDILETGERSSMPRTDVTTYDFFEAYEHGDEAAVKILNRSRQVLAGVIINSLTMVAPEIIVLGGGLCLKDEWYVDPVKDLVRQQLPIRKFEEIPIKKAELWDSAVLYGAVGLVTSI